MLHNQLHRADPNCALLCVAHHCETWSQSYDFQKYNYNASVVVG
jgi:hypothetical protein